MVEDPKLTATEKSPLKVVRVIARLNVGGPAIQAALLTSGLDKERFESTLVTGTEDEREGNMLSLATDEDFAAGVEPIVIPALGRSPSPLRDALAFVSLVRLIRRVRPDVVHTHTAKAGTLGRLAAWITGVPVIVHTFHGNVFFGYFRPVISRMIVAWERFLARLSTVVIAISKRQADELTSLGFTKSKVRVIPLGLPLARFKPRTAEGSARARRTLGITEESTAIGFIARLVPVKNPELMIEALAELGRTHPNVCLVVAGDGPLREMLTRAAAVHEVELKMLGWRADLGDVYTALDAVALSSRNEGLPVALIEAMASGVPVASTNVGGVADLFAEGEFGELAEADPRSLAKAIESAIASPQSRIEEARKSVLDRFGEERLISDIGGLYEELAELKRGRITRRSRRHRAAPSR